jgi:hypothetical protein
VNHYSLETPRIDLRRWHREERLRAGQLFSCSWARSGQKSGGRRSYWPSPRPPPWRPLYGIGLHRARLSPELQCMPDLSQISQANCRSKKWQTPLMTPKKSIA